MPVLLYWLTYYSSYIIYRNLARPPWGQEGLLFPSILYGTNTEWDMGYVDGMVYGKNTLPVCGMVCVDCMVREKHSIWYGTFAVWYHGTVSWVYYVAKFAWWYGMFQYIKFVRVEYVVRVSSVTTSYIVH